MNGTCPECGEALFGIDTRGRHEAEPCGCPVSDMHLDQPRVMTDGGVDIGRVRQAVDLEVLDPADDLEYLVALTVEPDEYFEDSAAAAEWAVAQWCQELQWVPDLSDYDTGQSVPPGADTDRLHEAFAKLAAGDEDDQIVTDGGTSFTDLHAFLRDALLVVRTLERDSDEAPMGLDIYDELCERYGEALNHSRVYHNLDRLADQGLVEKGSHDRRTNAYATTQAGRSLLERRARTIETAIAATDGGRDE
ncbi:helix-turn-helix transcriptional regulator [Halostella sp. PRR32]|uniref:helix-turn-helix transcriptional regulator n=1 Tax=Halostella sp. PRR32 TaxID=3098147 RepID=UPI002B1E0556|nr:helix-turn-helix transcriptional regulator [Halostella sp. PRR32]